LPRAGRTLQSWNDGGQVMIKDGVNIGNGKETPCRPAGRARAMSRRVML
jgi:hypothetical protein